MALQSRKWWLYKAHGRNASAMWIVKSLFLATCEALRLSVLRHESEDKIFHTFSQSTNLQGLCIKDFTSQFQESIFSSVVLGNICNLAQWQKTRIDSYTLF